MPHIQLPEGLPGILGPMAFRLETAAQPARRGAAARRQPSLAGRPRAGRCLRLVTQRLQVSLPSHSAFAARQLEGRRRTRAAGASDVAIHDTVLIAAAFCMFNRYVDGLGTIAPDDPAGYEAVAERIVRDGYRGAAVAA